MADQAGKKSPRAPSASLPDVLDKVLMIYDKERRNAVPAVVAAQDMGYKGTNSGAALSALANLGYYGLVDRPKQGFLSVAKDVENYRFAPTEEQRREIAMGWLQKPSVFVDLLETYKDGLPSDGTIKFDLIQKGFLPSAAANCVVVFRKSVEFVGYFEFPRQEEENGAEIAASGFPETSITGMPPRTEQSGEQRQATNEGGSETDRIPVRLSGGRRAWIEIPTPFYTADKERLKKQIDLLLTEDEDEDFE